METLALSVFKPAGSADAQPASIPNELEPLPKNAESWILKSYIEPAGKMVMDFFPPTMKALLPASLISDISEWE